MSDPNNHRPGPHERVQAHLRRMMGMMGAASIVGIATTVAAPACGPKSDNTGTDTGTTATDGTSPSSATWADPCFPHGCDPLPPPTTSTSTGTTT